MTSQDEVLAKIKADIKELKAQVAANCKANKENNRSLAGLLNSTALFCMFQYADAKAFEKEQEEREKEICKALKEERKNYLTHLIDSIDDEIFVEALAKLSQSRHRLTNEEEEIIIKISKKL